MNQHPRRQRFKNVKETINYGRNLLHTAHRKLGKPRLVGPRWVKDSRDVPMAFIAYNMIGASTWEAWRGIVSVAEKVLNEARDRRLPIVLYIADYKHHRLKFDPEQFFKLNDTNWRGTPPEKFYNIPARFGEQLEDSKLARLEDFEGGAI